MRNVILHRKLDNLLSPAKANIVQKELKAEYVADLLYYFPRKYVDRTIQPVALKEGNSVGLVVTVESVYHIFQRRSQLILRTRTEKGEMIECIWFHSPRYMQKIFSNNPQMFVFGKIQRQKNVFRIFHPDFEIVTDEENTESSEIDRIVPFYPISSVLKKNHLDNRSLRRIIHKILEKAIVSEIIPKSLLVKHRLVSRSVAIHNIHFPKNSIHLNRAIHRLKFEELFALNCHVFYRGGQNKCKERKAFPIPINTSKLQQKMLKSLPFSLTDDQKNAIHIFFNKISEKPALRILLQGDVGCGKTLTALSIGLHYIEADYQIALMVPTEVLAKQHFLTFANLMGMEFGNQMVGDCSLSHGYNNSHMAMTS